MRNLNKPAVPLVIAVLALALAMVGTASAAPTAFKITSAKVKKIAKKEIAKAAPTLSVGSAATATTATTAANATNAANANALAGKSLGQVKTVLAGAQSSVGVADVGTGTDVVSVPYTLAAPSRVNFSGVAELVGTNGYSLGSCVIRNDGVTISLSFQAGFDDIGTNNPASAVVLTSAANVPAGSHTAVLRCLNDNPGSGGTLGGAVAKEDATLNLIAEPN